jgi:hypothetical protein
MRIMIGTIHERTSNVQLQTIAKSLLRRRNQRRVCSSRPVQRDDVENRHPSETTPDQPVTEETREHRQPPLAPWVHTLQQTQTEPQTGKRASNAS